MDSEMTTTMGEEEAEMKQRVCHAAKAVEMMRRTLERVVRMCRVEEEEDGEGGIGMAGGRKKRWGAKLSGFEASAGIRIFMLATVGEVPRGVSASIDYCMSEKGPSQEASRGRLKTMVKASIARYLRSIAGHGRNETTC